MGSVYFEASRRSRNSAVRSKSVKERSAFSHTQKTHQSTNAPNNLLLGPSSDLSGKKGASRNFNHGEVAFAAERAAARNRTLRRVRSAPAMGGRDHQSASASSGLEVSAVLTVSEARLTQRPTSAHGKMVSSSSRTSPRQPQFNPRSLADSHGPGTKKLVPNGLSQKKSGPSQVVSRAGHIIQRTASFPHGPILKRTRGQVQTLGSRPKTPELSKRLEARTRQQNITARSRGLLASSGPSQRPDTPITGTRISSSKSKTLKGPSVKGSTGGWSFSGSSQREKKTSAAPRNTLTEVENGVNRSHHVPSKEEGRRGKSRLISSPFQTESKTSSLRHRMVELQGASDADENGANQELSGFLQLKSDWQSLGRGNAQPPSSQECSEAAGWGTGGLMMVDVDDEEASACNMETAVICSAPEDPSSKHISDTNKVTLDPGCAAFFDLVSGTPGLAASLGIDGDWMRDELLVAAHDFIRLGESF